MTTWTITIEATTDQPGHATTDQLAALTDRLDAYAGIATGTPETSPTLRYGATFTLDDLTPGATDGGLDRAVVLFEAAARKAGLPLAQIVRVDATTDQELDQELARPAPSLVGIAEIAELLGVNRQRASTLQTRQGFPPPAARLAAGPVWMLRDVEAFKRTWTRKPGRPMKNPTPRTDQKSALRNARGGTDPRTTSDPARDAAESPPATRT